MTRELIPTVAELWNGTVGIDVQTRRVRRERPVKPATGRASHSAPSVPDAWVNCAPAGIEEAIATPAAWSSTSRRAPHRAVLHHATDDDTAEAAVQPLAGVAGSAPVKVGGVGGAGRVTVPGGDFARAAVTATGCGHDRA